MNMEKLRHITARLLLCAAALLLCLVPRAARADGGSDDPVEVPGSEYATLSAAIADGRKKITVVSSLTGCNIPNGVAVTVTGGTLNMNGRVNYGTLTGALAGDFDNADTGTVSGTWSGAVRNFNGSVSGSGAVTNYQPCGWLRVLNKSLQWGNTVTFDNSVWVTADFTPYYYEGSDGYLHYCTSGEKVTCSITYKYSNKRQTDMKLRNSSKYPSSYCVSLSQTGSVTIAAAPDTEVDYQFVGWACDDFGIYEGDNEVKELTIPAGTFGNLTVFSCWKYVSGYNDGLQGASSGMADGNGTLGGMPGGGMSGGSTGASASGGTLGGLLGVTDSDDDDDDDETAVTNLLSTAQGGMRVRTASSVSRHTFKDAQSSGDIEAMASRRQGERFPWQWVGIGLGGALILFAVCMTIRRKLNERNAATLEKLNIHDN